MFTTLFMLVYGDYPAMHEKALTPLLVLDPKKVSVRLWLNAACPETINWLLCYAPKHWLIYISDQNSPKYLVMRRLFNDSMNPILTPWVTWLDDDTHITQDDWLDKTLQFITATPAAVFFGHQYWKRHLAGVTRWIRAAKWYTHRPFMKASAWYNKPTVRGTGVAFIRGSYWWLKTKVIKALGWPDARLRHNGGDTALSEAVWQTRQPQHSFFYGIAKELAPRRGRSEIPAGLAYSNANRTDGRVASMLGHMVDYVSMIEQTETPFVRLNASTLLMGSSVAYHNIDWPEDVGMPIAKKAKIRRKLKPVARRPASKQAAGKKITAGYMRAMPAAPKPARPKPAQPKPRVARSSRREVKTLKQLLQERHQKR